MGGLRRVVGGLRQEVGGLIQVASDAGWGYVGYIKTGRGWLTRG